MCSSIRGGGGFPFSQGRGGAFLKGSGGFPFGGRGGRGGGFLQGSSDDWPMLAITLSTIMHINVHISLVTKNQFSERDTLLRCFLMQCNYDHL
jgi:hypothetical protein